MDKDKLRKEIKNLLHRMILRAKSHGYNPLYFKCPYWDDEGYAYDDTVDNIAHFVLKSFPAQQVDGVPIIFKEDTLELHCNEFAVLKCQLNPDYSIEMFFVDASDT